MNSLHAVHQKGEPYEDTHEMLLINGLAEVPNDPIVQSSGADVVIGAGRHEDAGGEALDRLLGAPIDK
jgi:hypothetical protein